MGSPTPRVVDNDKDEVTVTLAGKEIRGWSYRDEAERRVKMLAAREFCEGWLAANEQRQADEDNQAEADWLDREQHLRETGGPDNSSYRRDMIAAGRG